jgi:hypothetical protein
MKTVKTLKVIISGFNNPMLPITRSVRPLAKFLAAMAFVSVAISGFANPAADVLDETHAAVRAVMVVQDEITPDLMMRPEILGTAVGIDATGVGVPALTVYVNRDAANVGEVMRNLPRQFRGVNVQVELTNEIRPMFTGKQTPPIGLGTSGGWKYDSANGYCCGGTLGSLVWIGSTQYILSNAHVLEREIAPTGASIIQPGLMDLRCNGNLAQTVGTLVAGEKILAVSQQCRLCGRQSPSRHGPNERLDSWDRNNFPLSPNGRGESARKEKRTHDWRNAQSCFRLERNC